MTSVCAHRRRVFSRLWFGRALLLTFVLRALIPQGYMPSFDMSAGGAIKLVICTTQGAKIVSFDAEGQPHNDSSGQHSDQVCAFAGLATASLEAPAAPEIPAPVRLSVANPGLERFVLPPVRAGPRLGSRGPPLLS